MKQSTHFNSQNFKVVAPKSGNPEEDTKPPTITVEPQSPEPIKL